MVIKKTEKAKASPRRRRKAKTIIGKLRPYAMPIGAAAGFVPPYLGHPEGIIGAIQADITKFSMTDATARLKANVGDIATPIIAGVIISGSNILGKYSRPVGDLAIGFGLGTGAKTILDPPAMSAAGARSGVGPVLVELSA
ncbi:hypothetical protein ES708_30311 [subsurface metagenome]